MKRARRALAILLLALAGCHSPPLSVAPTAETVRLRLLSTTATAPLLHDLTEAYQQANPQIHFAFSLAESNYATVMETISGTPPGEPLFALTPYLPPESLLWAAPIGDDQIAIIVHLENPLAGLSLEQLQAIFQGQIDNWAALGGADQPITVVSRERGAGTRLLFEALALGQRRVTLNARLAPSSAAVVQIVSQDRGALGYVSLGLVDQSVRALAVEGVMPTPGTLDDYPFHSPIFVIGREAPQGLCRAFIAWMQSPAGQAVVARRYHPLAE